MALAKAQIFLLANIAGMCKAIVYCIVQLKNFYTLQGMSDLLSPLLVELTNEADAYWCFEGLMQRTIFCSQPKDQDMDKQLVC